MPAQYLTVPERNARKNECVRGHPFSKENTAYFKNPTHGGMMRQCRQCSIDRKRAKRAEAAQLRVPKPKKLTIRQENDQLRTALRDVISDILQYERANNLAPNPGREYCWDSVARACAIIGYQQKQADNATDV